MQTITLSGRLTENAETKTDKRGYNYVRFKVGCVGVDLAGNKTTTIYRCYTYNLDFADLQENEMVFLYGTQILSMYKGSVLLDVKVQNITRGNK